MLGLAVVEESEGSGCVCFPIYVGEGSGWRKTDSSIQAKLSLILELIISEGHAAASTEANSALGSVTETRQAKGNLLVASSGAHAS